MLIDLLGSPCLVQSKRQPTCLVCFLRLSPAFFGIPTHHNERRPSAHLSSFHLLSVTAGRPSRDLTAIRLPLQANGCSHSVAIRSNPKKTGLVRRLLFLSGLASNPRDSIADGANDRVRTPRRAGQASPGRPLYRCCHAYYTVILIDPVDCPGDSIFNPPLSQRKHNHEETYICQRSH